MPKILTALTMDTAGPACQVVVSRDGEILADESMQMQRGHGEALVPMATRVLSQAQLGFEDLDRLAVTTGPGSFTGLRVAMAAARGFSATLNIDTLGIGTLHAIAVTDYLAQAKRVPRAAVLDARNGLVYGQRFNEDLAPIDEPHVVADLVFAASLHPGTQIVGPAQTLIADLTEAAGKPYSLGVSAAFPAPKALARLAAELEPGTATEPLYLKDAAAAPKVSAGLRETVR